MVVSLHLQGIAPYFRRTLVHHLYLLGSRCIQHERYNLGDIQQGLHQDQQLHSIALQHFRGSLSVLPVQLHQHYLCRFHASSLREGRPNFCSFKDCDVQERDAGDYLGHLADDSPERIPGWKIMAASNLCRLINRSGFCIKGYSRKHLLRRLSDDGPCEGR